MTARMACWPRGIPEVWAVTHQSWSLSSWAARMCLQTPRVPSWPRHQVQMQLAGSVRTTYSPLSP